MQDVLIWRFKKGYSLFFLSLFMTYFYLNMSILDKIVLGRFFSTRIAPTLNNNKSDQVWSSLIKSDQVWSSLNQLDLFWTNLIHLNPFDPFWSNLIKFEQVWSSLNKFDQVWSSLIKSDQVWSSLSTCFVKILQTWKSKMDKAMFCVSRARSQK